jgi:UDP-N-acetylmuramoyl-L-alanyl-D-glutamate--2,6-diaminopimelate ligase
VTIQDLLAELPVRKVTGPTDRSIAEVQYDSRRVAPGDIFVAIRGAAVDGHRFLPDVIARGASAVVVESSPLIHSTTCTELVVDNSRAALADCANIVYRHPSRSLTLVGVTGTNGKTTTTTIIRHLLTGASRPAGIVGTIAAGFGETMVPATHTTPEAPDLCRMFIDMRSHGASAVAMEVSSHALALDRVRGFRFAGAVYTNLTQDHLDFHGTMEAYFEAKAILFNMLEENAVAAVNADDPYGALIASRTRARVVRYGLSAECEVRAERVEYGLEGTRFVLSLQGERYNVISPYIGAFNVYNLLAGIAVVAGIGVAAKDIVGLIAALPQVRGRLERIPLPNGAIAVVDYAHTPDALQRAIETVRMITERTGGNVITVFGCGGDRDRTKRPMMGAIAARMSDTVIVTSDNPRTENPKAIIDEILAGVVAHTNVRVIADRTEAIQHALGGSARGDVVLLAGKGHETYQVVGTERLPFDDAAHVRSVSMVAPPC